MKDIRVYQPVGNLEDFILTEKLVEIDGEDQGLDYLGVTKQTH